MAQFLDFKTLEHILESSAFSRILKLSNHTENVTRFTNRYHNECVRRANFKTHFCRFRIRFLSLHELKVSGFRTALCANMYSHFVTRYLVVGTLLLSFYLSNSFILFIDSASFANMHC